MDTSDKAKEEGLNGVHVCEVTRGEEDECRLLANEDISKTE